MAQRRPAAGPGGGLHVRGHGLAHQIGGAVDLGGRAGLLRLRQGPAGVEHDGLALGRGRAAPGDDHGGELVVEALVGAAGERAARERAARGQLRGVGIAGEGGGAVVGRDAGGQRPGRGLALGLKLIEPAGAVPLYWCGDAVGRGARRAARAREGVDGGGRGAVGALGLEVAHQMRAGLARAGIGIERGGRALVARGIREGRHRAARDAGVERGRARGRGPGTFGCRRRRLQRGRQPAGEHGVGEGVGPAFRDGRKRVGGVVDPGQRRCAGRAAEDELAVHQHRIGDGGIVRGDAALAHVAPGARGGVVQLHPGAEVARERARGGRAQRGQARAPAREPQAILAAALAQQRRAPAEGRGLVLGGEDEAVAQAEHEHALPLDEVGLQREPRGGERERGRARGQVHQHGGLQRARLRAHRLQAAHRFADHAPAAAARARQQRHHARVQDGRRLQRRGGGGVGDADRHRADHQPAAGIGGLGGEPRRGGGIEVGGVRHAVDRHRHGGGVGLEGRAQEGGERERAPHRSRPWSMVMVSAPKRTRAG